MNADKRRAKMDLMHYLRVLACACGLMVSISVAQTSRPAAGLDSLSDETLMNELAARGLSNLLDRTFEINHVPKSEQESRRALLAMAQLSDKCGKLTARQRQDLMLQIVAGIESALPSMRDPDALMKQA